MTIPKGCTVLPPGNLNSHHPHWINPAKFNPERFESEEYEKMPEVAWTPFYAGRRKCIGTHIADLNMRLSIGNMIKRFDLKMDQSRQIEFEVGGLTEVKEPMVKIKMR